MDKFIPIDKQSKKKQKEFYAKQRGTWGTFNPVTRTVPNGKAYNRNKLKQEDRRSGRLSYGKQDSLPLFVWLSIEVACENCPTSYFLTLQCEKRIIKQDKVIADMVYTHRKGSKM